MFWNVQCNFNNIKHCLLSNVNTNVSQGHLQHSSMLYVNSNNSFIFYVHFCLLDGSRKKRYRQRRRGRNSGGRRTHRNPNLKESEFSSDDFGSIESSPEAYRDREWTGFRFKSKVPTPTQIPDPV
jgi:hypothetical protein